MRSQYALPNYAIALIILCIISVSTMVVIKLNKYRKECSKKQADIITNKNYDEHNNMSKQIAHKNGLEKVINCQSHRDYFASLNFWTQLKFLTYSQFKAYRPGCVNILRIFEVSTLGALVGLLFYDVGNNQTAESLSQKTGLLFFSVTLWTFTRMYPSVGTTSVWYKLVIDFSESFENQNNNHLKM